MNRIIVNLTADTDSIRRARLEYTIAAINSNPTTVAFASIVEIRQSEEGKPGFYEIIGGGEVYTAPKRHLTLLSKKTCIINSYDASDVIVYSVEENKGAPRPFIVNKHFAFDIFETIFFHLSRYEEQFIDFTQFLEKRLEFEQQLLVVEHGVEKIPIVDDLIRAFLEVITGKKVPTDKVQSVSHDIDYIEKYKNRSAIFRKVGGHLLHGKPLSTFKKVLKTYRDYALHGLDPYDNFEWLLSKQDIAKAIYFLVGGRHENDNTYDLQHPIFRRAITLAKERSYQIGIHPSFESWTDLAMIIEEKKKLEEAIDQEVLISRQHYLNFDISTTPHLLQSAGILEDSSLGFTRHVGYRSGTAYPYKLYDFKEEKAMDLIERPLVFMDSAWWHENSRNGVEIEITKNLNGCFNFHNSFFDELSLYNIDLEKTYRSLFV